MLLRVLLTPFLTLGLTGAMAPAAGPAVGQGPVHKLSVPVRILPLALRHRQEVDRRLALAKLQLATPPESRAPLPHVPAPAGGDAPMPASPAETRYTFMSLQL